MSCVDFKVLEKSSIPKRRIDCYKLYLKRLVDHLNHVHKVDHGSKYWEIIIGPWLIYFIWYVDYRLSSANGSLEKNEGKRFKYDIPYDMTSYIHMFNQTDYAFQLDSMISRDLEGQEITFECFRIPPVHNAKWKVWVKKIYTKTIGLISSYSNVILVSPYFSIKNQIKVILLSRLRIVTFFCSDKGKKNPLLKLECRKWLKTRNAFDSDLDTVLDKLVLQQIPYVYLEGYSHLLKQLPPLPPRVKVICSSVGWLCDELLQCFFARHQEKGGLLVGLQHGGGPYGIGINPVTLWEKEMPDTFLTWGWKLNKKDIPFVSMGLSFRKKEFDSRFHSEKKESILYATTTLSSYEQDGMGRPSGKQMSAYIKQQHQFVKSLSLSVRKQIVVRVHSVDYLYNHKQREQFDSLMLKIRFDENKSFVDSLLKSRLVVLDNIQTVFFEVIAYGIPVMVFHDESMWKFNDEFDSICEEMKRLRMLHTSPESIAKFLSELDDDIEGWWNAGEVQDLLEHLRSTYARTSHAPERVFIDQLNRIMGIEN
jgi:putative transferase (TIGR04331 family)